MLKPSRLYPAPHHSRQILYRSVLSSESEDVSLVPMEVLEKIVRLDIEADAPLHRVSCTGCFHSLMPSYVACR